MDGQWYALYPSALSDQLIRFYDLLRALLGVLDHRIRQPVRLQLVGMMSAQLAPVRFDDVLIAVARRGFEDFVGLLELLRVADARLRAGVRIVEGAAADAQHRLDLRKLEGRHAEAAGDS